MSDQRPSWDATWLSVADVMSQRSRCARAQIGAVIVSSNQRLVASSYNGPSATYAPANTLDPNTDCRGWCPRAQVGAELTTSYDECCSIHAEENGIAYVDRSAIEGGTIYVTGSCCMRCAKLISNSGIQRVMMRVNEGDSHRNPDAVINYLKMCGIVVKVVT